MLLWPAKSDCVNHLLLQSKLRRGYSTQSSISSNKPPTRKFSTEIIENSEFQKFDEKKLLFNFKKYFLRAFHADLSSIKNIFILSDPLQSTLQITEARLQFRNSDSNCSFFINIFPFICSYIFTFYALHQIKACLPARQKSFWIFVVAPGCRECVFTEQITQKRNPRKNKTQKQ
jgi:hypothetical protein